MNIKNILAHTDHTLLKQTATWSDIMTLCDEAVAFGCASVCIPPTFVKMAKAYVEDKMKVCTVIGFPNGYHTSVVKAFEASEAVKDGADEIDMVIDLGMVKMGNYEAVLKDIQTVKEGCHGRLLKVIIETCLLTDEEKIKLCKVVTESGAEYIKTSTGFSKAGATFADIELFSKNIGKNVKIKAAGGISTLEDAEKFLSIGADRLGSSRIVCLAREAGYND